MKITLIDYLRTFFMFILIPGILCSQEKLDVQGDAKIQGNLDINTSEDTSSIFIGRNITPINVLNGRNTFIGVNAGQNEDDPSDNTFVGFDAGKNNNGNANTFFGSEAGEDNDGSDNSFFGNRAGWVNKAPMNAFFGYETGRNNNTGAYNSFFGAEAGQMHTSGEENTYVGYSAGGGIKEGSGNTLIGANARALSDVSNAIAIGSQSRVNCDNCAAIGGVGANAVKVGIGVNSPTGHLEVYGGSGVSTPHILLHESVGTYARLRWKNTSNANTYWDLAGRTNNPGSQAGAELNFFYNDGSINVLKLFGDGDATLAGNLTENSDQRLKKDILPIQDIQNKLYKLNAYEYKWKNRATQNRQIGFLAQEVQRFFPELVREDEGGMLSVNYTKFVPLLLQGFKEQQQQIDEQRAQILALEHLVKQLIELKESK